MTFVLIGLNLALAGLWWITIPEIRENWRSSKAARVKDWRFPDGMTVWDYSGAPKEPKYCNDCQQPAQYGRMSTYDRVVGDCMLLAVATCLVAVVDFW